MESCSLKFRLLVTGISFILLLIGRNSYSQQPVETFKIEGYVFSHERQQLKKLTNECSDYLNRVSVKADGKVIFNNSICGVDINDVRFIQKGYLTVLEHYSSPVGWFEYFVFDLCKKRIIKTKRIDEGKGKFTWEKFIELDQSFRKQYVAEVTSF
jgi:hypothetical protein